MSDGLSFGDALFALKQGKRVARSGWNGKGMWLILVKPNHEDGAWMAKYVLGIALRDPLSECKSLPWIGMKTADDKFVPWLASQTDMLAEDWSIVA